MKEISLIAPVEPSEVILPEPSATDIGKNWGRQLREWSKKCPPDRMAAFVLEHLKDYLHWRNNTVPHYPFEVPRERAIVEYRGYILLPIRQLVTPVASRALDYGLSPTPLLEVWAFVEANRDADAYRLWPYAHALLVEVCLHEERAASNSDPAMPAWAKSIPHCNPCSADWITTDTAAKRTGLKAGSLRNARSDGDRLPSGLLGRDKAGRIWAKSHERGHCYYFGPSIKRS